MSRASSAPQPSSTSETHQSHETAFDSTYSGAQPGSFTSAAANDDGLTPRQRSYLNIQGRLGNQAAQRTLVTPRSPVQRSVVQRYHNDATAQAALQHIAQSDLAGVRAVLQALDTPGPQPTQVSLPGGISVDIEDRPEIGRQAASRLVELLMTQLHTERTPLVQTMNAAADNQARRTATEAVRAVDVRYLPEIKSRSLGRQPDRYGHPNADARDSLLAALQLESVFNAEGRLSEDNTTVHNQVADRASMSRTDNWCGFFAADSYVTASMDSDMRAGFFHVDNVENFFQYRYDDIARVRRWIAGATGWEEVRQYHQGRGALRQWTNAQAIFAGRAGTLDIRPGDVVLIDIMSALATEGPHRGHSAPNHIAMVQSWNPQTHVMYTIGGNDGGYVVDTRPGAAVSDPNSRAAALGRPLREPTAAGGHVGVSEQNIGNSPDPARVDSMQNKDQPRSRVYGIGRPSLVDFEDHRYFLTNPRTVPTPDSTPRGQR